MKNRSFFIGSSMKQCQGITRVGKRCSITACSKLANDGGRLASGPLLRGGDYCLFHAKPFCTRPVDLEESPCYLVVMLDLETTGTDISNDRIVEFAASQCPADSRFFGGAFSTVVHVEPGVLETRGDAATPVHGISNEEIMRNSIILAPSGSQNPLKWCPGALRRPREEVDSRLANG